MGLIYCPNCKHKISSKSIKCLYCGYQIKEDPYQKALKSSFNRLFYLTIFGIITVIIPALLLPYFHGIFQGVFLIVMFFIALLVVVQAHNFINKKQKSTLEHEALKSKNILPIEEIYYYKGKTNQQLQQYNEALGCYEKALKLNPDFEPAKKALKHKAFENRRFSMRQNRRF